MAQLSGQSVLALVSWGAVLIATLVAAVLDVRWGRISNRLTVALLLSGLVWSGMIGGMTSLGYGIAGALLLAMPFVILFVIGGGGAGDAKLMAGVGAWLGVGDGAIVLVAVLLCGGIMGVCWALVRRRFRALAQHLVTVVVLRLLAMRGGRLAEPAHVPVGSGLTMPYGLAIFLGVAAVGGVKLWHG